MLGLGNSRLHLVTYQRSIMSRTSLVHELIFLTLIGYSIAHGNYDFANLNNLGDQISRNVQQQLAPLQNLGPQITAHVERQLAPLRNRKLFDKEFYSDTTWRPQQPFVARNQPFTIPKMDLSSLDNLGQQIQQSVYEGLEPVRALEIVGRMKKGIGGITISTYLPEGKKFIIRKGNIFQCSGSISESDGKCDGELTSFSINDKKDYCYFRQSLSIVNNHVCIGAGTVSVINNEIKCLSNTGTPALLVTLDEFKELCGGISSTVEYKYIANPEDPAHVVIPNPNKYVKCANDQPGICIFSKSNSFPNSYSNIIINT